MKTKSSPSRGVRRALWATSLLLMVMTAVVWTTRTVPPIRDAAHGTAERAASSAARSAASTLRAPAQAAVHNAPSNLAAADAEFAGAEQRLQAALAADPLYVRYRERCAAASRASAGCREQLSNALYQVFSHSLYPFVVADTRRYLQAWQGQVEPARARLLATLERTRDPARTALGVALLRTLDPEHSVVLPRTAYEKLVERSDAEAQLILDAHSSTPLPSAEIAAEVADLALDSNVSDRVRLSAVYALGHPENARELERLVGALTDGDPSADVLHRGALAHALASCAEGCRALFERLGGHASAEVRAVAYRALQRIQGAQVVERLTQQVIVAAPLPESAVRAEMQAAKAPYGVVDDGQSTGG